MRAAESEAVGPAGSTSAIWLPLTGDSAPASGMSCSSLSTLSVVNVTPTRGSAVRPSLAPTASQPGEAAGVAIVPKRAPVGPSFPAAATSTAPARSAPSAAIVSGEAPKAANGSATGARITSAWSERLPSPFGSSARSTPASRVAVVPLRLPCCSSITWIGSSFASGATPCRSAGPSRPATMPAIAVPWAEARGPGDGSAALPLIAFQPGARSCKYGWPVSTGPSSNATVTPRPARAPAIGRPARPTEVSCLATVAAG